ncbi:MAG: hypothetical protein WA981_11630 [Glaciecola sp.]
MKRTVNTTTKLLCCFALALPLFMANGQVVTTDTEAETANIDKDVEVIGVVGQKPLSFFRRQMASAELDFYDAFNAVANEEKFKIKCRRETTVGSNMKRQRCYPQYMLDEMAARTQDVLSSGGPYPSFADIEVMTKKEKKESLAYLEKVVLEHPQLLAKLIDLNEKQALYEQKKQ